MKTLKAVLIPILIFFACWAIGLLSGLSLMPSFETNFYLGNLTLDRGLILEEAGEQQLELLIPWDFNDSDSREIVLTIYPYTDKYSTTLNKIATDVIVDGNQLTPTHFHVLNQNDEEMAFDSVKDDTVSTRIEIRSSYPLREIKKFQLHLLADYLYNNKPHRIDTTFNIDHETRFKWKGLGLWSN